MIKELFYFAFRRYWNRVKTLWKNPGSCLNLSNRGFPCIVWGNQSGTHRLPCWWKSPMYLSTHFSRPELLAHFSQHTPLEFVTNHAILFTEDWCYRYLEGGEKMNSKLVFEMFITKRLNYLHLLYKCELSDHLYDMIRSVWHDTLWQFQQRKFSLIDSLFCVEYKPLTFSVSSQGLPLLRTEP